jgi:hypothetical protein
LPTRSAIVAGLVALGAALPAAAAGAPAVRFRAALDRGAQLGGSSALSTDLAIDTRRLRSPVTEVRVLYPAGLGIVSSGLGLVSCAQPASAFQDVLTEGESGLGGCSPNAVLGFGTVQGDVRLADGQVIPEYATLTLLSGAFERDGLGLVLFVIGQHPFGARLTYAGELRSAQGQYGGAIVFHVPPIPSIADLATVALTRLQLSIGSRAIVYYAHDRRRSGRYHPAGIALPASCPRRGLHFRVALAFADGGRAGAQATLRCPRSQIASAASAGRGARYMAPTARVPSHRRRHGGTWAAADPQGE